MIAIDLTNPCWLLEAHSPASMRLHDAIENISGMQHLLPCAVPQHLAWLLMTDEAAVSAVTSMITQAPPTHVRHLAVPVITATSAGLCQPP